jgi:hypothetical protein
MELNLKDRKKLVLDLSKSQIRALSIGELQGACQTVGISAIGTEKELRKSLTHALGAKKAC